MIIDGRTERARQGRGRRSWRCPGTGNSPRSGGRSCAAAPSGCARRAAMHELSLCQALLDQVAQLACEHHARRVVSITLRIGPPSDVEPALLESVYPLASAGTVAADAVLMIDRPAVRLRCRSCRAESEADGSSLVCGACGQWRIEVLCGDERPIHRLFASRGGAIRLGEV